MSITQALSNATSGLSAASRRAGVTSNNIANALTEGYSRRDVELAERVTAGVGAGVLVSGISRAQDPAITYERRLADNTFARDDALATAHNEVAQLIGSPGDPFALFERYAAFEQSLQTLADAPGNAASQLAVVNAANELTNNFARIAEGYQSIRERADSEIATQVNAINQALQSIEELNTAIGSGGANGTDVNALIDQRARLIDQVNEQIPVRELQRSAGQIDLITPEGVFLIAGEAKSLSFSPSPIITAQSGYNNGAGALSGLSVDGVDITPGGPSTQGLQSGALSAQFAIRDTVIPEAATALDALALDLADRFSDPALDSTLPAGAPGLFTDNGALADITNLTGLAGRLQINASVDPSVGGAPSRLRDGLGAITLGPAGNDSFVRSLIDALGTSRTTNAGLQAGSELNASEAAAHIASLAGSARSIALARADVSATFAQTLNDREIAVTGVDTDAELQKLLQIEQAYAANARVIETVDRLLQRLLEI
ncbi:MAG: flagellar hook-associated protein FlgK [Pseudomonadota bacterium]